MIGTEIQNYRIIQMLGKGGMATVYKAQHKTLAGAFAAIKVLHPALAADDSIREKFRTEAQLMSTFSHPNIGRVYDYAEDRGNLYLIMEYVEGPTLDELIRLHTGPIVEHRARNLFAKMLSAVGYAHRKGVIHRDLKPANILIAAEDEPKIIDFGIVKMIQDDGHPNATRTGQRIGTPMFMSPEQIIGRGVDNRTDIYALGVTLFQMVTGQLPYDPEALSQFEIEQKIVNEPLPRIQAFYAGASPHFQALIDRATARQKEDRFQSCEAFLEALHSSALPGAAPSVLATTLGPAPAPPVADRPFSPPPVVPVNAPPVFATPAEPAIFSFSADRNAVQSGEAVTLRWDTSSAQGVTLMPLGNYPSASGVVTVYPESDTSYVLQAGRQSQTLFVSVAARKKNSLWLIGVAAAIALGTFAAVKWLGDKDSPTTPTAQQTTQPDRPRTVTVQPRTTPPATQMPPEAQPPDSFPPSTATPPYVAPSSPNLSPEGSRPTPNFPDESAPVTTGIPYAEREHIQNIMLRYFTLQNSSGDGIDVESLLDMFSFPAVRYFGKTQVSAREVAAEMERYYGKVVTETNYEADVENARIRKSANGNYTVDVSGPYTFRLRKNGKVETRNITNRIVLNSDYKIISISEN